MSQLYVRFLTGHQIQGRAQRLGDLSEDARAQFNGLYNWNTLLRTLTYVIVTLTGYATTEFANQSTR